RLLIALQVNEGGQLVLQDGGSATNRFFRIQSTVGFQVDDQFVQVSALFNPRALDYVGHAANRGVGSIELQTTDGTALVLVGLAGISGLITATTGNRQFHVQRAVGGQRGDVVIGIDDLHIVIQLDIASGDRALTLLGQGQGNLVATMHLYCQTLEVQQDLDDIFLDAFNGAVLMQNAIDFRLYHGTTGHRREQSEPQRTAQGMPEATLTRPKSDLGARGRGFLNVDLTWSKKLGNRSLHERHLLLTVTYLEESATIRFSLLSA